MDDQLLFSVSDFVAYLNQTLETAYPYVTIEGELSNYRVSKNRWVYFDLKDAAASVRFFGTVYNLPGPLEDGMVVRVSGSPRLHAQFGFNVNFQTIQPVGEGALRKAADLLQAKLTAEGLFDAERKRALPYPPQRIALVTAGGSAAYADFIKITNARWRGMTIDHYDVLVQGERSPGQIVAALQAINALPDLPDVIVLTRGGGSAEDLSAFSTEQVTRAVAGSRVPTLVAIGHEIDLSLSELAADRRASTPSNAAELLTPDRKEVLRELAVDKKELSGMLSRLVHDRRITLQTMRSELDRELGAVFESARDMIAGMRLLLEAYNPTAALQRGYAVIRANGAIIKHVSQLNIGQGIELTVQDGTAQATITAKEQNYAKKSDTFDYRAKAAVLDGIMAALQDPEIQIDEATKLHADGMKLVSELEAYLQQAENTIRAYESGE